MQHGGTPLLGGYYPNCAMDGSCDGSEKSPSGMTVGVPADPATAGVAVEGSPVPLKCTTLALFAFGVLLGSHFVFLGERRVVGVSLIALRGVEL